MSNSNWRARIAVGVVVGIAAITVSSFFVFGRPQLASYPTNTMPGLEVCGYQQARAAADEARKRRDQQTPPPSAAARADAAHEAEAAENRERDAYECEKELHDRSDLMAQWNAAIANKNSAAIAQSLWWWSGIELILLLFTLGAAFWAAREAKRAADATEKGNRETANQAVIELRPYITVKQIEVHRALNDTKDKVEHFGAKLVWENCGSTPSRGLTSWTSVGVYDAELPRDFAFPDLGRAADQTLAVGSAIGPGQELHTPAIAITNEDAVKIADGSKFGYIWAWVEYDDGFEGTPRRRTETCSRIYLAGNFLDAKQDFGTTSQHTGRFNAVDDECLRQPKPREPKK